MGTAVALLVTTTNRHVVMPTELLWLGNCHHTLVLLSTSMTDWHDNNGRSSEVCMHSINTTRHSC